jgi:hypothetical protein
MALAGGQGVNVDHRLLRLEGDVGEAAAVGRPGRRDDRLARGQRGLRVHAVGVGDLQLEAAGALDDIGDAGGEDARLAEQLLVDEIGDAMPGGARLRGGHDEGQAAERGLLLHVVEAEAHLEAAVGGGLDAADDQGVGALRLPVGEIDRGVLGQRDAGLHQLEQAAALQVGAHHHGHGARDAGLAGEIGDGDGNAVGAGAGDLDGQLGAGGEGQREHDKGEGGANEGGHHHSARERIGELYICLTPPMAGTSIPGCG